MYMQLLNKKCWAALVFVIMMSIYPLVGHAEPIDADEEVFIDRIQLVTKQINLLKNRYTQAQKELKDLEKLHDEQLSQLTMEKASKNLMDKASLDISVSKSNLDSINIELTDSQQTINWLEKSSTEIENQLNVLSMFSLKVAKNEIANVEELRSDLNYQQELLELEKERVKYLQDLQTAANNNLQFKKERYNRLSTLLKSHKMMHIKQQQVKDELAYQELQHHWLTQLDTYYARLETIDPIKNKPEYASVERDIYYANESASFAYIQSLIARYTDQIQQMKLAVSKSNSISLLNEIGNQLQILVKQITRLDSVLTSRMSVLDTHVKYLSNKKKNADQIQIYIGKLHALGEEYKKADAALLTLNQKLSTFRHTLDQALQSELSSRQGLPSFGIKMLIDLGKEILLVPALTFQMVKSLSSYLLREFEDTSALMWSLCAFIESLLIFSGLFLYRTLSRALAKPSEWREKINTKWLSLQWTHKNFIGLAVMSNLVAIMFYFEVPAQSYMVIVYLSFVWLIFNSIMLLARIYLIEATHDAAGHDVRLYNRLKWVIRAGGVITAVTVFVHQLPLIYELKMLCDEVFLIFLMIVSILLLKSWHVVSTLLMTHFETRHPYIQRCIRLLGITVPLLMFGNSLLGMIGYVNLVMTITWYEGIFMVVLTGYLMLRGLLSDAIEQVSNFLIEHASNGWLWTEAFLKPINKLLRLTLLVAAGATLFLFYGWDKQSPIVERLTSLMHYKLANVLNTTITPINIIAFFAVLSVFYWTAKWTREFVYRLLTLRTKDMGIRNSIAILSQYSVVVLGVFICLRVLGIDMNALAMVTSMFALGIGLGLRDLVNNFACGFLILIERPLRVGDIVNINGLEGEVTHFGGRAITIRTWDHMELVVPNTEIFNKCFTNWTARDNIVRAVAHIKIGRHDNPHSVKVIIQNVLHTFKDVLRDPAPEVYLKEMNDTFMEFEIRYFVNIRQVKSRTSVMSAVLMNIWDAFGEHGIKPPYPQQEILIRTEKHALGFQGASEASN